jgi:septal ring factor EnvC (AmiA/AmiB activator)
MSSDQNTLDAIPALKLDQEEIAFRQQARGRRASANKPAPKPRQESSGGWLLVLLCLLAVAALGGWTYLLNQQLQSSRLQLSDARIRLQKLERRLSVTDESASQSSVALQVKIKEMDAEIRKLWDNVWKRAKQDLVQHGKDIASLQAALKAQAEFDGQIKTELSATALAVEVVEDQLEATTQTAGQLSTLQEQLAAQQQALMEIQDSSKSLSTANEDLKKRVAGTEEWVDSFNGYRTQMNRKLLDLQGSIKALQEP